MFRDTLDRGLTGTPVWVELGEEVTNGNDIGQSAISRQFSNIRHNKV